MSKVELLSRIQNLTNLVNGEDLKRYELSESSVTELRQALDRMTDEYIKTYC